MTDTVELLRGVPLLSSLSQKELEKLSRDFTKQTFPAGKVIVREGDTHGVGFFVVAAGEGVITVKGNEVGKVGPGSYFGEVAPASWAVKLPKDGLKGGERFAVDVLDTWNCTVTEIPGEFSMSPVGAYDFHDPERPTIPLPGRPWMAVRMRRLA